MYFYGGIFQGVLCLAGAAVLVLVVMFNDTFVLPHMIVTSGDGTLLWSSLLKLRMEFLFLIFHVDAV